MISPTAAQKFGADFGRNPVGTGAFVFREWNQGTSIVLARNPSYWQADLPYLDGIVFRDVPNHIIGLQRLIVGEVDYVNSVSPDELRQVEGNGDVEIEKAKIGRWFELQYQVDKPPFNNLKLRQAIAYALDRDQINQVTMRGRATLANGPTPPGLWWSSPDKIVYDHDPEKSKALLKEAGIAPGTQLTLSAPADVLDTKIVQLVAEQLAVVGLQVKLEPVSVADSYARVISRAINFTPGNWTQRPDPDGLLSILLSSKGFANTTGYNSPQMDQMLAEARSTIDQQKRKALYAEIKELIQTDLPYISLYFGAEYAVLSKKVGGFAWIPDQIPRFRELWIKAS
jgi:peptide/nickel transport system substrate-binding protein